MISGSRIKEARKKLGYTQKELGDLIHVTKTSICCYESGVRTPNVDTLEDLARELHVPISFLFTGDILISENNKPYGITSEKELSFLTKLRKEEKLYEYIINGNQEQVIKNLIIFKDNK